MSFKLQLTFIKYVVHIQIQSTTLSKVNVDLTFREFEQVFRKPRLLDYVDSVYIDSSAAKYIIVTEGVKVQYSNATEHPIISQLITYRKDFEFQVKRWMKVKNISYTENTNEVLSNKPMQSSCIWLVPQIKVVLGISPHIQPPEVIGQIYGCPVVDRTNTICFGSSKLKTDHPMPDFSKNFTTALSEIMMQRAEELWRWIEDTGKLGIVWWSGGIDSTALLVAMLRTATPERIKLIKVGMNERSINEYPLFFNKYVRDLPYTFMPQAAGRDIDLNVLHITGEIGDQLFGSDYLEACFAGGGREFQGKKHFVGNINAPWQDTMSRFVRDQLQYMNLPSEYVQPIMDTYEKLNTASPIEINTLFDFWWWSNFNLKYSNVVGRIPMSTQQPHIAHKCIVAFFNTPDFQRWSVFNHDKKIGSTWKSYKKELKQFVFDFNKDKDWFTHKTKGASLGVHTYSSNLVMDSNYQVYGLKDKEQILKTYFGEE